MTAEANTVVVETDLEAPPETVWRALSDPDLRGAWLAPGGDGVDVGKRFTLADEGRRIDCEVLECSPYTRFVYSWKGGLKDSLLDTICSWTLSPTTSGGTLLHLSHAGFEPSMFAYQIMSQGWRNMNPDGRFDRILDGEPFPVRECEREEVASSH